MDMQTKERRQGFKSYLKKIYEPSLHDAEMVFKLHVKVNTYCRNNGYEVTNLFDLDCTDEVVKLRQHILNQPQKIAFRKPRGLNDRLIVIDKYIDFLYELEQENSKKGTVTSDQQSPSIEESMEALEKNTEGFLQEINYFRRKRNRKLRDECARKYDYRCCVCEMSFKEVYGERGAEFIEVHHTKPMASYDDEHPIELEDLRTVCSNCHSMIHFGGSLLSVEELTGLYEENGLKSVKK